jgi:hypothetical protein
MATGILVFDFEFFIGDLCLCSLHFGCPYHSGSGRWHYLSWGLSRIAQKQELEEVWGIKNPVFVQIFKKAALEQKNLDSSSSIL